ncbi:Detoxifying efflux carrier 35 isoform 3 [Hibiscus syriacus]|uniref:Detoxifying efflux carrier 35 isoform 3 n=1 Tax=Hibiscus syriacus TaxID=106335 RepID=A0A6A3AL17_HIBSY|nr:Detoxifying efflux carrier 35 isoform 3 [Hibiscus syriacus]
METKTPLLNGAPSPATTSTTLTLLENGDYAPVNSFEEVKWVFWIETVKMWKIAGPIAFQIFVNMEPTLSLVYSSVPFLLASWPIRKDRQVSRGVHHTNNSTAVLLAVNCPTGKFFQAQSKITLAQVAYAIFWCDEVWTGFSWLAFKDIWAFVRLSIASAVMLCLEVWYMISMFLVVGHLDNAVIAVGSLSICMNLNGWEAMLFIGINAAMSVRVSNELGWGHPRAAKYSVYVTVVQSLLIGLLCTALLVIFTSSKTMQRAVSHLAYLLGITMVLNSVQPVITGVAVGGGWQSLVAYITLGCYYAFGLPLGCLLGYIADFGVMGLWGGMIAGTASQTLLLLVVLLKTNWNKEVEQTSERMKKWGGQDISTVGTNSSV